MKKEETNINNAVVNAIVPQSLAFMPNNIEVSDTYGQVFGVTRYPTELKFGWMSRVTNMENATVSVMINYVDEGDFINALNRNIVNKKNEADTADNNPRKRIKAERSAEDSERLLKQIENDGTCVCEMAITYKTTSNSYSGLDKLKRKCTATLSATSIRSRLLSRRQDLAFKQIMPSYTSDKNIMQMCGRMVPLSTFVGGFPNASSGFADDTGDYFAMTIDSNNMVFLDTWVRGNDRTNSNIVILGNQGQGKSTVVKHIAQTEYKNGVRQIFIDPEGEYKEFAYSCEDGVVINLGGGKSMINPFEIRPVPQDDDEEEDKLYSDDGNGLGALALHLKTLEIFFSCYLPEITLIQKSILKNIALKMYNSFGFYWDTDVTNKKHTDFPTFTDFYQVLKTEADKKPGDSNYSDILILLQDIVTGSDSFLFNGYTNIDTNAKIVVLDTSSLVGTSDILRRTQYFNILTWCWEQMSKDRYGERVRLYEDEAYLMIDKNVPQCLTWNRNAMKRDRKYEAAISLITHSVVDLLDPSIKMFGQPLLEIPCYKIMFGTEGQNLKELKELYKLTDIEEEILRKNVRGQALMIVGGKRLGLNFEIPKYKLELMGKAGGR